LVSGGAPSWFHNILTYNGEVIEYWTIFSIKIHFNQNSKLLSKLGTLLIVLESPRWVGLNEDNLEIFRPKVREILNFEYFLSLEI
jgi:hypothetical protein